MEFKTQFSGHERLFTEPGSPFMDVYTPKVDKSGHTDVVKTGKTNLHELIQVDKDSCDINLLMKRYTAGDLNAIDKIKGVYLDTRDFPENYAEFLQRNIDANIMFDKLPVDIKQQFDNSADVFWSTFGDEHFLDVFGLVPDKEFVDNVVENVDNSENVGGEE